MRQAPLSTYVRNIKKHDKFLKDLSTRFLFSLLKTIGANEEKLSVKPENIFVEPFILGREDELDSSAPDLIVIYEDPAYKILLAEAKGRRSQRTHDSLEDQLTNLKSMILPNGDFCKDLIFFFQKQNVHPFIYNLVPVYIVGVYKTRDYFGVYHSERMRKQR